MRNSKIVFLMAIFVFGISSIKAQATQSKTNSNTEFSNEKAPQANVTYKTIQKTNKLIEQVNILAKGDDVLTEKTIFQIQNTKKSAIKRIVADNEYILLSKEIQQEAIKESEVINIINQLKK